MNRVSLIKLFLITGLATVIAALLVASVNAYPPGDVHSLVNASADEVNQAALKYTRTHFKMNGTATFLLTRSVTKGNLPALGLPAIDFAGEDPPLMLVAIKGDFDVQSMCHTCVANFPNPVSYIVYVFDLKAGAPTLISTSRDGASFRILLNDPSLPEETPVATNQPGSIFPNPLPIAPAKKLPYGAFAPTIMPPTLVDPNIGSLPTNDTQPVIATPLSLSPYPAPGEEPAPVASPLPAYP